MEYGDRGWTLDLERVRSQVQDGNYAVRSHAMQHAVKEGFSVRDMVHVVLHGSLAEEYPQRQRGLVYADISLEFCDDLTFRAIWGRTYASVYQEVQDADAHRPLSKHR